MSRKSAPAPIIQNVVFAVRYAQKHGTWVVIVCPTYDQTAVCRRLLAAAVPEEAVFSGRTALLPDQGRVSVVAVQNEVFVPEDDEFQVLFVGWSGADDRDADMAKWYEDTSQVLREHPL